MNDFIVVVETPGPNIISIETGFIDNIGVVEIERQVTPSVNILGPNTIINISDLPEIPFSKITGSLDVSKISGLNNYLNHYQFDCGTP
jgi:hypothetical protein